jgi:hypothetical protein
MEVKNEKRGEILPQLAIIADLLENINLEVTSKKIFLDVTSNDFERVKTLIEDKMNIKSNIKNSFTINVGEISIIFNKL